MTEAAPGVERFSLGGKVFLVTGASGGIGLAIARGLAAAGAIVGVNSRSREHLEAVADSIPNCVLLPFDVADLDAASRAVEGLLGDHGRLDGVVCNVGARDRRPIDEVAPEDFRALLETNLVAPFELARLAARHMVAKGAGRIIFTSSIAARHSRPGDPAYGASKGGIDGLTRALAVDLGPHGVTVNAVAPGPIATEANQRWASDPEISGEFTRQVPLGRWGTPDEVAAAVLFLASDAASFVNGHILTVDGGATAKVYGQKLG